MLLFFYSEINPTPINVFNDEFLIVIICLMKPLNDIDTFFFILVLKSCLIFYNYIGISSIPIQNVIWNNLLSI